MNRKEKLGQLEELLYNFINYPSVETTEDDIEALRFAVNELSTTINEGIKCIEIPEYIKQPSVVMHSTMATELENEKIFTYKREKEDELSLGTICDKVVYIDDALTCDFLVKKIVDGKEVISRVEGYVTLAVD